MHLLHSRIVHSPDCAFAAFHYLKDQQRHRQSVGHTVRATHKRDETMAILNTIHAPKSFTTGGVTGMIEAARARFAQYRVYRKTLSELGELSNRELADLGLNRSMLKRIALEAAYGEVK